MIYTVTFNPSLDYIVTVDDFMTGVVNRTSKEIIFPGGKGINVSMVLSNLGYKNTALGFMAGFTGEAIIKMLEEKDISTDFIHVAKGTSRINVKLRASGRRYLSSCRKYSGYDARVDVHGYHGLPEREES